MKPVDLQMHTTASDGIYDPKKIIDLSLEKNMKVIAITDHDSVDGIKKAIDYANGKIIEFVPGIELSCYEASYGRTIDILGLFIDYTNKELIEFIERDHIIID